MNPVELLRRPRCTPAPGGEIMTQPHFKGCGLQSGDQVLDQLKVAAIGRPADGIVPRCLRRRAPFSAPIVSLTECHANCTDCRQSEGATLEPAVSALQLLHIFYTGHRLLAVVDSQAV